MDIIGRGLSADVYDNNDGTVVKIYHSNMPKEMYLQDYEISSIVNKHYKNTPKVYGLTDSKPYPGIIFEKIDGRNLITEIKKNPLRIRHYAKEFAKVHYAIHGHCIDELPNQIDSLTDKIRIIDLPEQVILKVIEYTSLLSTSNRLCHNDFMPGNVVCDNGRMVVIDWRTATQGNPLGDIARTIILNSVPRKDIEISFHDSILRKIFTKEYESEYMKLAGISKCEIEKWLLPLSVIRLGEGISKAERKRLYRYIMKKLLKPISG